ncbi:uroporphyrinogen decarboxylase family protein [Ignisphaera sp. 4213-co]|uniref:Uroporphyrinogen decarboxylase family protein n=1 Tax=Ignisphaera cupida TaxID=3050454 RepID=A0ABD4ZAM4_9CREN|nr:uroporphyrinogen decarboxylase family protein [Ignisphaera sp. 4213-co]MDK6029350.1 uroporphyrinogen decarboxylase family protein [Ignisphaera sp. 4213-co]
MHKPLTHRERLLRVFSFQSVDRVPNYEFGYWKETIDRWHNEGLPQHIKSDKDVEKYLGLEGIESLESIPVVVGLWPPPIEFVLREEDDKEVVADGLGGIYVRKKYVSAVPHYIRFPIRSKDDWKKIKRFLDFETPGRISLNWSDIVEKYRNRDYPLRIFVGSLVGWLRDWMGIEGLSKAFYRDPDWVEEMVDTIADLVVKILDVVLRDVVPDMAWFWEDIAYNKGPLISPKLFEKYIVPRYKRITKLLNAYGVKIVVVDCDGNIELLVPGWLDGGVNCMFPLEARYVDPYKLRREYGEKILLMGGVDKMALIAGEKAIDKELERLTPLLEEGGYIPTVDHRVPPEVSYKNYLYYIERKREWLEKHHP